jgi:peptidoglycan/LPS O-acetylase OafA/YrhL
MGHSSRFLPYLGVAAVVAATLIAAGVPFATYLPFLVALACPLAMVVMMRGMAGTHGRPSDESNKAAHPVEPPAASAP